MVQGVCWLPYRVADAEAEWEAQAVWTIDSHTGSQNSDSRASFQSPFERKELSCSSMDEDINNNIINNNNGQVPCAVLSAL